MAPKKKNDASVKKGKKIEKIKGDNVKKKRFQYAEESLKEAIKHVQAGAGVRESSRLFGIPRATLQDYVNGRRVLAARKCGPEPILGVEGENRVAQWVIDMAKCGFPIKKQELLSTVEKIVADQKITNSFRCGRPGEKWFEGFLKRHPDISIRQAEGVNKARALITEESIRLWFKDLRKFLEEHSVMDILDDPQRIFNGDEAGFSLCPKTGKVLAPRGYRNLYEIKRGKEKENITVLVVFSASGNICPPLVVFPYVRPPKSVIDSMPDDWVLGKSNTGWMKGDIFFEYIVNEFDLWLTKNNVPRPAILFVDGHKSHMSMMLSQICHDKEIILYALPPNTTHIMQPADVSVFKPLKSEWNKTVRHFLNKKENANKTVTKTNFCRLYKETLESTNMKSHIINGFRKCGIYPLNEEAVDYSKCIKNILENMTEKNIHERRNRNHEITKSDLKATEKVITALKPTLTQHGMNVELIIDEIRGLKDSSLIVNRSADSETTMPCKNSENTENISIDWIPEVGSLISMNDLSLSSLMPLTTELVNYPSFQQQDVFHQAGQQIDVQILSDSTFSPTERNGYNDRIGSPLPSVRHKVHDARTDIIFQKRRQIETKITHQPVNVVSTPYEPRTDISFQPTGRIQAQTDTLVQPLGLEVHEAQTYIPFQPTGREVHQARTDISLQPPGLEEQQARTDIPLQSAEPEVHQARKDIALQPPGLEEQLARTETPLQPAEQEVHQARTDVALQLPGLEEQQARPDTPLQLPGLEEQQARPDTPLQPSRLEEQHTRTDTPLQQAEREVHLPLKLPGLEQQQARTGIPLQTAERKVQARTDISLQLRQLRTDIDIPLHDVTLQTAGHEISILSIKQEGKRTTPRITGFDAFKKHLTLPEPQEPSRPSKKRTPAAISSLAWREFHQNKEKEKLEKKEEMKKKRMARIKAREMKLKEAKNRKRKITNKENKKTNEKCYSCGEDLISDIEDDEEKNVGCDRCPRWFHLKCTKFAGLIYSEIVNKEYNCDQCN